jgi:5,10-methenyltetrahydrofolate synthetase
MTKEDLRRALLAKRQSIIGDLRRQTDAALGARVYAWWQHNSVRTLAVYWPIQGEADLLPTYAELARNGVRLALPVVRAPGAALRFAAWLPGDVLAQGAMKVPEPLPPHREIHPDAILIPCVGFNRQCFRLGYGGGFYDRTLAAAPRPLAIGIGYDCGLAEFAAAPHDIALDAIITESATLGGVSSI